MTEVRLVPLCATGGDKPCRASLGNVVITETPGIAIASVTQRAGGSTALSQVARELTGFDLPGPRRTSGARDALQFVWTGPDQWFAFGRLEQDQVLADLLTERLRGAASVTEQTDGWVCFTVEGSDTTALLERLCPLDLARMEAGMVDRTVIEHMNCFVICDVLGAHYRVLGTRSSAVSLFDALTTVADGLV